MMIDVKTINQFKVLQHIRKDFDCDAIQINPLDDNSIMVTDSLNESLVLYYEDGEIKNRRI